jgi:hypothetical protein
MFLANYQMKRLTFISCIALCPNLHTTLHVRTRYLQQIVNARDFACSWKVPFYWRAHHSRLFKSSYNYFPFPIRSIQSYFPPNHIPYPSLSLTPHYHLPPTIPTNTLKSAPISPLENSSLFIINDSLAANLAGGDFRYLLCQCAGHYREEPMDHWRMERVSRQCILLFDAYIILLHDRKAV